MTKFKNYQKTPVFVSTLTGRTFRIQPGETKDAPDSVIEDCLRAGLVPLDAEDLNQGGADEAAAEAKAAAEAAELEAQQRQAAALEEASEKAKRSAAAKKAAATRKAKAEAEANAE